MKKIIELFFLCCAMANSITVLAQQSDLRFRSDKKFKIVQFTDIHWVPGNPASEDAYACMNAVLDAEKPDLVVYTGDLVYGKPAAEALQRCLKPVVDRKIPFAVTWGNHDDEQDLNRQALFDEIKDLPGNCTARTEGLTGVTNYILPLKSSAGNTTSFLLYVFDSNAYTQLPNAKGYAGIQPDQVQWYIEKSKAYSKANGGTPYPAMAFFHIPFPEYNEAAQNENTSLTGTRKERACSSSLNYGLFASMLQCGDVMATFVGHDHINDYAANWKNILLCYGRFTGGDTVYCNIPGGNGARVIELMEGVRSFTTWIRLHDGKVIHRINYPEDYAPYKSK